MILSINQPAYLPYLPQIEKIKHADIFVFLDTVSYSKNGYDNRNRIIFDSKKDRNGLTVIKNEHWLTIPISTAGKFGQNYKETKPATTNWIQSHLDIIKQAYKNAPNFDKYFPELEKYYKRLNSKMSLSDICFSMLPFFLKAFDIKTRLVRASNFHFEGHKTDLIIDICKKMEADTYYSGKMGHGYLDENKFKRNKIKLLYQEYIAQDDLSCIHKLFTEGAEL